MPAVIPFIPLIVGGIAAGATVYASNKAGSAADKATAAQQGASDKELAYLTQQEAQHAARMLDANKYLETTGQQQSQLYGNALSALSPYTSLGAGAAGALGYGLGITPGAANSGIAPPAMPANPGLGNVGEPIGTGQPLRLGGQLNVGGTLQPPDVRRNSGEIANPPTTGSAVPRGEGYRQGTAAALVTMQAPDGSVEQVPQALVNHYLQQGARVVSA